jgi:hypothetical protein
MASTLPTFSDLSLNTNFGLPTCVLDKNSTDPLGLNHYSYFSNLELPQADRDAMSKYVDTRTLLFMTWKEENAAFWLSELYRLASDPVKRLTLLREAYEEQEHFSILVSIIKQLFSQDEITTMWTNLKNNYDKDRAFEYFNDLLNNSVFDYAANEIKVLVYIEQIKQHTSIPELSTLVNSIISEEFEHLEYGPIFVGEETFKKNQLMYKLRLKEYFNEPFKKFTPGHVLNAVQVYCENNDLDYQGVVESMQTTQRHRDFVIRLLPLLYEFGKAFTLIKPDTDFESTLREFGVFEKYQLLTQY